MAGTRLVKDRRLSLRLSEGLPDDFDYSLIRNAADARWFIFTLRNSDRGKAAVGLHTHRELIGRKAAYAGIMYAWNRDHGAFYNALQGDSRRLAEMLNDVCPPVRRSRRLRIWRGVSIREGGPSDAALGLSWTTDRDVACWFAMRWYMCGVGDQRPFVFEAFIEPTAIVALWNGRGEREVIVDPTILEFDTAIWVEGKSSYLEDLDETSQASPEMITQWREGYERYMRRKADRYKAFLRTASEKWGTTRSAEASLRDIVKPIADTR